MTPTPESQQAAREWRCFHCDELFTTVEEAADHFGVGPTDNAACQKLDEDDRALLKLASSLAKQLDEYRNENTPADKLYYTFRSEISQQAIRSEELGYRRGVEDGRRDWLKILWWRLKARFA